MIRGMVGTGCLVKTNEPVWQRRVLEMVARTDLQRRGIQIQDPIFSRGLDSYVLEELIKLNARQ